MSDSRLRVTIARLPLVVQPTTDEAGVFAPAGRGVLVRGMSPTADDRAAGRRRFEVVVAGWRFEATVESATRADLRDKAARAAREHHSGARMTLQAQIPGRVVRLWVAEGEQVEQNQRLLAIEAMKMENEIRAPYAGVVAGIRVDVGTLVERNDELLTIG
jgi:biotin carboxyl carrier protein